MVSPSSLLARARRAARNNGATLVGDKQSGRFSHELVKGEYRMAGQRVVVTITEKHWLLPWPVVEVRLRELLASASGGASGRCCHDRLHVGPRRLGQRRSPLEYASAQ